MKKQLAESFWERPEVSLDLFHAVKRIIEKIPKCHKLRMECTSDLHMVFRDTVDRGPERKVNTPDPQVITEQMKEFQVKWKDIF